MNVFVVAIGGTFVAETMNVFVVALSKSFRCEEERLAERKAVLAERKSLQQRCAESCDRLRQERCVRQRQERCVRQRPEPSSPRP